jgi:hypothetical protein
VHRDGHASIMRWHQRYVLVQQSKYSVARILVSCFVWLSTAARVSHVHLTTHCCIDDRPQPWDIAAYTDQCMQQYNVAPRPEWANIRELLVSHIHSYIYTPSTLDFRTLQYLTIFRPYRARISCNCCLLVVEFGGWNIEAASNIVFSNGGCYDKYYLKILFSQHLIGLDHSL